MLRNLAFVRVVVLLTMKMNQCGKGASHQGRRERMAEREKHKERRKHMRGERESEEEEPQRKVLFSAYNWESERSRIIDMRVAARL